MRNLKFKYAKAENFFCFEKIELNFEKYGPIVLVTGQNLDSSSEDKSSNNGLGKTSCASIPVYALYGKPVKNPTKLNHADIINYKNAKKLTVEFQWDDYRVVRSRDIKGTTTLKLWRSDKAEWTKENELTKGGIPATQKTIEDIIGLNYTTFVNLYIFNADDPTSTFLELETPKKREIVENLLSLDKYRTYNENAKELLKKAKDQIKLLTKDYEHVLSSVDESRDRVKKIKQQKEDWQQTHENEIINLNNLLKKKMSQLESTDTGSALAAYTEAQQQMKELQGSILPLEEKRDKFKEIIEIGTPKLNQALLKLKELQVSSKEAWDSVQGCTKSIESNEKSVKDIEKKIGGDCPYCLSQVTESNFEKILEKAKEVIVTKKIELETIKPIWDKISSEVKLQENLVEKLTKGVSNAKNQLNLVDKEITDVHASIAKLSKIKEPQANVDDILIQNQVEELKNRIDLKSREISPFLVIYDAANAELVEKTNKLQAKKEEIEAHEKNLPYYNFWIQAFGDGGIRKYIIDGIIPALNGRLTYWLQYLIDNKIRLSFDNELKETIDKYPFLGKPYVYHGCSGGQRRRLNLSVAASFAYVQLLNVGCMPSAIWLDEISMNMDEAGVDGIYKMICELAKERQVFVIDHNQSLLQMLDGCDKVQLVMRDGVTTKVN